VTGKQAMKIDFLKESSLKEASGETKKNSKVSGA
jgi:hypothetical protein